MIEPKENIREVSELELTKMKELQQKWGDKIHIEGAIRILGEQPVCKIPGNGRIKLGNKVVLNSDFENSNTALTYRCTLVCGIEGHIEIGENSMLNGVSVTSYKKVSIGKNCHIASSTLITDTDFHPVDPTIREQEVLGYKIDYAHVNKDEVKIGDNVWIGWGSIILKGVTIGDNSIIGAGSVVISDVPANTLAAGNPAKIKKNI